MRRAGRVSGGAAGSQSTTPVSEPISNSSSPTSRSGQDEAKEAGNPGFLVAINAGTKWIVSGAVAAVVAWQHNEAVAWCLLGSIANSVTSKLLKRIFNHSRPPTARKQDPGMPSSHAQSLAFLGTYTAAAVVLRWGTSWPAISAAGVFIGLATFLTWLRVRLGFHTVDQVVVGAVFGGSFAALWLWLWETRVVQLVTAEGTGKLISLAIFGSTATGAALFVLTIARKWLHEVKSLKK